jgi:hypothetical protein
MSQRKNQKVQESQKKVKETKENLICSSPKYKSSTWNDGGQIKEIQQIRQVEKNPGY